MILSEADKQLIRECSKDGAAYDRLLMFMEEKAQQDLTNPSTATAAISFEMLFNVPHDAIFLLDLDGNILSLNDATVRRLKQPREALIGLNIFDFFTSELAHRRAIFDSVVHTRKLIYFEDYRDSTWFSIYIYPVFDRAGELAAIGMVGQDITEQRYLAEELYAQKSRYQFIVNQVKDVIFQMDTSGRWVFLNPAWEEIMGYSISNSLGRNNLHYVHPDDRQQNLDVFLQVIKGQRGGYQHECRYLSETGITRYMEIYAQLALDDSGHIIGLIGILRDVSERRRMEMDLQESLLMQRAILEAVPDLMFRFDKDGNYLDMHAGASEKLYAPVENLVGRNMLDILPESMALDSLASIRKTYETKQLHTHEYMLELNGEPHWFESRLVPLGEDQVLSMVRDITERRRLEDQLRESELRYRSIITTMAEGIMLYERNGTLLHNEAALRLMGLTPEQMLTSTNRPPGWHTEFEDGTPMTFDNHPGMVAMRTGQSLLNVVLKITKSAGEITWVSVNVKPLIRDGETTPYAVVTSLTDITEIKEAQKNEIALQVERQKMGMITRFIQDASHEFRTPLSIIGTSAYFIKRKGDDKSKLTQQAAKIELQIERLTRLVDMLLLMSRLDSESPPPLTPYYLSGLLNQVVEGIEDSYAEKTVQLICDYPGEIARVGVNVDYFHIALDYLLENALKFTPTNGTVRLSAYSEAQRVLLIIEDSGIGMSQDDLTHIFQRFWRKDNAHTTPGFGLGLPIAQKIIHLHHGEISVSSTPDEGTCFTVSLPLVDDALS